MAVRCIPLTITISASTREAERRLGIVERCFRARATAREFDRLLEEVDRLTGDETNDWERLRRDALMLGQESEWLKSQHDTS